MCHQDASRDNESRTPTASQPGPGTGLQGRSRESRDAPAHAAALLPCPSQPLRWGYQAGVVLFAALLTCVFAGTQNEGASFLPGPTVRFLAVLTRGWGGSTGTRRCPGVPSRRCLEAPQLCLLLVNSWARMGPCVCPRACKWLGQLGCAGRSGRILQTPILGMHAAVVFTKTSGDKLWLSFVQRPLGAPGTSVCFPSSPAAPSKEIQGETGPRRSSVRGTCVWTSPSPFSPQTSPNSKGMELTYGACRDKFPSPHPRDHQLQLGCTSRATRRQQILKQNLKGC